MPCKRKPSSSPTHRTVSMIHTDIRTQLTPLYTFPYSSQLSRKSSRLSVLLDTLDQGNKKKDRQWKIKREKMRNAVEGIEKKDVEIEKKMEEKGREYVFYGMEPSPVTEGYRNKCEFTIGLDENGEITVGFNVGRFVEGHCAVNASDDCLNIPKIAKVLAKKFGNFLSEPIDGVVLAPWDKTAHTGFWRLLTIRNSVNTREVLILVQTKSETGYANIDTRRIQNLVKSFFANLSLADDPEVAEYRIVSLSWQLHDSVSNAAPLDCPIYALIGPDPPVLTERLLGLECVG